VVDLELVDTVRDAVSGSQSAWDNLVESFSGLVWGVARAHGLAMLMQPMSPRPSGYALPSTLLVFATRGASVVGLG
jgi:hypothetical protein